MTAKEVGVPVITVIANLSSNIVDIYRVVCYTYIVPPGTIFFSGGRYEKIDCFDRCHLSRVSE